MSLQTRITALVQAIAADVKSLTTALAGKAETSHTHTAAGIGAQPADPDLTAIAALTGTTGLLKKTAANTWELDTSGGGGSSEDSTTSFTYTYTGVMGMPPMPLPGSGLLLASPAGNERAFNVLFVGTANPDLTGIEFTKLELVAGNLVPKDMPALTSLSLPALTTVMGNLVPCFMYALTTLSLPALTTVGGTFQPYAMPALTSLSLPALTTVVGTFNPYGMDALTSLSAPALTTVGGSLSANSMAALTTLSLPALTAVMGNLIVATMPALTSLSLPAIERIGASVTFGNAIQLNSGMSALTTFTLPATLKQVGGTAGNVTITSAALNQASVDSILVRLAALDGTDGTVAFSNRTVTITGTSAAPSSAGLAAKATLVARGCTVTHN